MGWDSRKALNLVALVAFCVSALGCATPLPSPTVTPTNAPEPTPVRQSGPPIELYIDGMRLTLESPPHVENSIVFVPGRELFEALGYVTYLVTDTGNPWIAAYVGGYTYSLDDTLTKFHIEFGSKIGIIDPGLPTQHSVPVKAPARLEDGEGMLPLGFVADNPGLTASYDPNTRRIDITTGRTPSSLSLQPGAAYKAIIFKRLRSNQLADNRIGNLASGLSMDNSAWEKNGESHHVSVSEQFDCGIKRWSLTINNQDWEPENWDVSEFKIDPGYRPFYEQLTRQGFILTYNLIFKDKDFLKAGGVLGYPRFKNDGEIQRYLDYVRTTVRYFKGVVAYYEVWNEQNIQGTGQYIEPDDYINLVKRVVPIIREEDPAAKISVGQTTAFHDQDSQEYTYRILESDLMPIVDAVAIHPFFWDSPESESEYYYDYPTLLRDVKETAWAHGFRGEFIGGEGNYSPNIPEDWQGRVPSYSKVRAGIYTARGILTNLGLDFSGGINAITMNDGPAYTMICNLDTLLAGAEPKQVGVELQSGADQLRHYGFSLPNGDTLVAVWTDGVAKESDLGANTDIRITGFSKCAVSAIDILNSTEQEIVSTEEHDTLVLQHLLIKDYPIIIRIRPKN